MRYKEILEVNIDNVEGWGSTPLNQEVNYFGLRVLMRPLTFLKLAAPLNGTVSPTIQQHIKSGGSIAAPFLRIKFPEKWFKGDFSDHASVLGHEGRNRMHSVLEIEGDDPIEVHLFFNAEVRRRHLTPEIIEKLNSELSPENKQFTILRGPFFEINT